MRYPVLVDKRFCKTDIKVILEREGLNKYGEPFPSITLNLKCNYQDNAKTVLIGKCSVFWGYMPRTSHLVRGKCRSVRGKKADIPRF